MKLLPIALLASVLAAGCTTSTTYRPDGSRTVVTSQDPKVVKAIAGAVADAAAKAAVQAIEDQANKQNGLP